jgi:hypothetical protein
MIDEFILWLSIRTYEKCMWAIPYSRLVENLETPYGAIGRFAYVIDP